ncbi:MAG: OmpA family protein [Myxococcota bacterium]
MNAVISLSAPGFMQHRSRRPWLVFIPLGLALASAARAEPRAAFTPEASPPGDAHVMVSSPDARGKLLLRARLSFDYVAAPLELTNADQLEGRPVDAQLWSRAAFSLALWHRVLLFADLPHALRVTEGDVADTAQRSLLPGATQGFADPALGLRARLLGAPGTGLQMGVGATAWLPFGSAEAYAGDDGARLRVHASVGSSASKLQWASLLAYTARPSVEFPGVLPSKLGSAVSLGVSVRIPANAQKTVAAGPELLITSMLADGARLFDPRTTSAQFLLAARYRPRSFPIEIGAAVGPALGSAPASGDYRVSVLLGWCPEEPAPPPDYDADGVPDAHDTCFSLPGVASNDPLMNGCPALPLDTDEDSVPDAFDACPRAPGVATRTPRTHGCPKDVDHDADTIPDASDACPDERGEPNSDPKANGCPPPAASLSTTKIEIAEQVQFETGTAVIKPESDRILSAVLKVLRDHPELELIRVEGHTDDRGTPELNRRLSQERATSVVSWLVSHGIVAARLVAKGYGPDRPIDENTSEAGRARNRRVEFRILRAPGVEGERE